MGGATWRMIPTAQLRSNTRCRAAFDPVDANTIISPHGWDTLKISHDGGETWSVLAKFDDALTGPITNDPHAPASLLVGVGETVRLSADGGKTWQIGRGVHGRFVGGHFARSPAGAGTIFAATERGVWRSDDRGRSWKDASAGLPFNELRAFSGGTSGDETILYCTIPGKSSDGQFVGGIYRWRQGGPWEPVNGRGLNRDIKPFDEWAANQVAQYHDIATSDDHPETVWATNGNTGVPPPHHATVYRSDNAGETWRATFYPDPRWLGFNVAKDYTVVEDGQFYQDVPQIAVAAHDPAHVLQINGGECYYTTNGGHSWNSGHTQCVGDPRPGCAWRCTGLVVTTTWHYYIDPHESQHHYICYTDIGFARSTDAGQTWHWWSPRTSAPWRNTCYELAFDPDRPGHIWGAFSNVHDIPNSNIIWNRHRAAGSGGICVSNDFASAFKPLGRGAGGLPTAPATAIVVDPHSPATARTLYAGFFGKGVYKSTDDGATWTPKNNGLGAPANMRICRVQLHPDGTLFALVTALVKGRTFQDAGVGLYRSKDGGDSWQCLTRTVSALWPKDFTLDPADSRTVYLSLCDANGQEVGGLYRTTNTGEIWQRLTRQGPEHFGAFLHPNHPGWIYATLTEDAPTYGLYLSKDNGQTFQPLKGMPFDNAMRITFDPADANVIYVSTFGGSVWRGPAE